MGDSLTVDDAELAGGLGGKMRFRGFSIRNDDLSLQITEVRYSLSNEWAGPDGMQHAMAGNPAYVRTRGPVDATNITGPLGPGELGAQLDPGGAGNEIRPTQICIEVTWVGGATPITEHYKAHVPFSDTRLNSLVQIRLGLRPGQAPTLIPESTSGISGAYRNEARLPTAFGNDWMKFFDPTTITGSWGLGACP